MLPGSPRTLRYLGAVATAAAAYMLFESQWLERREEDLSLPGLPPALVGLRILHLSDVHAGQPGLNLWTLQRAVRWARHREPDLVVLTGDILSSGRGARRCLDLLALLEPRLGAYAVTGNHEYGLSKNPLAHSPADPPWSTAGITLLSDECATVDVANCAGEARMAVCGADYLTGGYPLRRSLPAEADFALLLIHRPPEPDDPLAGSFPLAFAGHTHGGQIRIPTPWGRLRVHRDGAPYAEGIHPWGGGVLVLTRGIGTTFLPLRLATRPQATLYRLVG